MLRAQDEAGNRVHLSYVKYREGLEHAFSELYMGKDCYGNRCVGVSFIRGIHPTSNLKASVGCVLKQGLAPVSAR